MNLIISTTVYINKGNVVGPHFNGFIFSLYVYIFISTDSEAFRICSHIVNTKNSCRDIQRLVIGPQINDTRKIRLFVAGVRYADKSTVQTGSYRYSAISHTTGTV